MTVRQYVTLIALLANTCLWPAGRDLYAQKATPLFESLSSSKTGINFKNTLLESPKANVLTYEYFYNGGGVAIGDINNDGLDDIYFTANMKPNVLYLNQGNFKFKDITSNAGVSCDQGWKTGVTMADVNADGFLDIYVSLSGKGDPEKRRNKLYINNGDLTFTEKAKEAGLDDPGHSTHASFFDFDRDGDLDMYLLNHNVTVIRQLEFDKARKERHPYAGDKLFRNDNGKFTDISSQAGIKGNPLGFGLGVTVADVNKDGWLDVYVSNDYVEPDYLYINNKNGTFTDRMTEYMQHISYFSMGCDVSDINNDEWPDIFTVDMLPEDNHRQKLLYGPDNYEHYALMVMNGFYFQNMRNMLHLNNRDGTYSEVGQFAGISNTDWSWAPLFADFDNDGWKDLFISNGYYRDYTNRDFLKYRGDYYFQQARAKEKADTFKLVTSMTSTPVHDYMFRNNGDLTFKDVSNDWGFSDPDFSSGASYSDLDNDGDLDLVVNHQNATASVYRNSTRERTPENNFIQIQLPGAKSIGAQIRVYTQGQVQYYEHIPGRGFQSSVSHRIHVGLGRSKVIDSLKVTWPTGKTTLMTNVDANQVLKINDTSSAATDAQASQDPDKVFLRVDPPLKYEHVEQGFNDFKRQPLLMTMITPCGPVMATADVNADGRTDIFVGGTEGNPGKIFLQDAKGLFSEASTPLIKYIHTDADALFFDVDGDLDSDLYVVSGGYNDYKENDKALQDRLYLNDGKGNFSDGSLALPEMTVSKSCIAPYDFDRDGDLDIFLGGRVIPGKYPVTPESFLLRNTGGKFENIVATIAPAMSRIGMVTDASWVDVNSDGWNDLVIVGEFMPIEVFINEKGARLVQATTELFDTPLHGIWSKLITHDFDRDGDDDLIVGNLGRNTQLRASGEQPVTLVYKDFDKNGSIDPFINHYIQGNSYPFATRDDLLDQMYSLRSKYTSYASYADVKLRNIFSSADLKDAGELKVTKLETVYLENKNGKFVLHELPSVVQFSPVHAMTLVDYNRDGNMDVVLAGNESSIRIRLGVIDANFGQLLRGDGKGNFSYVPQGKSGMSMTGDAKSLEVIKTAAGDFLFVGINNVGVMAYQLNREWQQQKE